MYFKRRECFYSIIPKNKQALGSNRLGLRRRQWHPTPVFLPGKSHGWRSLVGCSPWGRSESDMTEQLHFQFSLSCIGEGNGNPLQCSCLEDPREGGAWWAAVYGVAQSRTRMKRLSSSSRIYDTSRRFCLVEGKKRKIGPWTKLGSDSELRKIQVATCAQVQVTSVLVHIFHRLLRIHGITMPGR